MENTEPNEEEALKQDQPAVDVPAEAEQHGAPPLGTAAAIQMPEGTEPPPPNSQRGGEGGVPALPGTASEQHEQVNLEGSEAEQQPQSTTSNQTRYPYPPEGYYPPGYPPPPHHSGDGGHGAAYPPPPREGYPGAPPYGVPPHMGGYPMYSYHQPPMYPHYPGYPPPPMYGYPQPEGYPEQQGPVVGPYAPPMDDVNGDGKDDDKKGGHNPVMPSALGSASRLKTYIKPRPPSSQDVLDRRSRKNAQSRARAEKLRERIAIIETKKSRSEEEKQLYATFESRRQRKNDRSRERALEKKEEIDRILAKPEKKRSKIERQFLDGALNAKKRKNEGDRLRRQRLKELGLSSKTTGLKPGISARGPIGIYRGGIPPPPHPYGAHMGEMPMSPLPPMAGHPHHPGVQSPGGYVAGSPGGMMPGMGFVSPQHPRRSEQGVLETPGRQPQGAGQLPYIPPSQAYDGAQAASQNSRVEQRRHPDGSMSISIGGEGGGSYAPEGQDGADIPDFLYNGEGPEGGKDV